MTPSRAWILPAACAALGLGCATARAPGGGLPAAERAIVRADSALSAGLPVQVRLRKAGERTLAPHENAAELPPGEHELVVDCRVAASGATRRFVIRAELEAGAEYRLVAEASARNCDGVELVRR